jgi:hypothetical protein
MTLKTTLAYGRNFHFYQEALNNNYVYLELKDIPYDVGYRRLMIAIPIDIWETIRDLGAASFDLVNSSDTDLMERVVRKVDERIAGYQRIISSTPERANMLRFENSVVFGTADETREQQIRKGMIFYKTERERQREVVNRTAQHKIIDINNSSPSRWNWWMLLESVKSGYMISIGARPAMPKKKYLVTRTAEERSQLEQLLRGGKAATRKVTRARILLKATDVWPDQRIAQALNISRATVERTRSASSRKTSQPLMNARVPATSRSWTHEPKLGSSLKRAVPRLMDKSAGR